MTTPYMDYPEAETIWQSNTELDILLYKCLHFKDVCISCKAAAYRIILTINAINLAQD